MAGIRGRWRTDTARNLHRKPLDSCKLSVSRPRPPLGLRPWTHLGPQTSCAHPDFRGWLRHWWRPVQDIKVSREKKQAGTQVGAPVHNDQLNVRILAVFMQEVRHEVGHWLVRDVTTQHDMPASKQQQFVTYWLMLRLQRLLLIAYIRGVLRLFMNMNWTQDATARSSIGVPEVVREVKQTRIILKLAKFSDHVDAHSWMPPN